MTRPDVSTKAREAQRGLLCEGRAYPQKTTIFVGLDVHKKTIAVATVEGRASAEVRFYGTIANTPDAIRSLLMA